MPALASVFYEPEPCQGAKMTASPPLKRIPHERLIKARKLAGYDVAGHAADEMGVPRATYYACENGQNKLTPENAELFGNFFGADPGYLLTGIEEQKKNAERLILGGIIGHLASVRRDVHVSRPGRVWEFRFVDEFKLGKIAYLVEGTRYQTAYKPGTVIICAEETRNISTLVGEDAVVCIGSGGLHLYTIENGSVENRYNLLIGDRIIHRDAFVQWAQQVVATKPRSQWRHVERDRLPTDPISESCDKLDEITGKKLKGHRGGRAA